MEDNAIRAIMIAVGIFVIMLVLTGIILYVSTARNMATTVDKTLNSWDDITVTNIMDYEGDIEISCTGMDFINFLRRNYTREDIYVTINDEETMQNQPISWWKSDNTNNINEIKIAKIDANASIVMKKKTTTNLNDEATHSITVIGELFSARDVYMTDKVWSMKKDNEDKYAYVTDGETILRIGDKVNYQYSGLWTVLGANNGKILLIGSALSSTYSFGREFKLSHINQILANCDSQNGAVKRKC